MYKSEFDGLKSTHLNISIQKPNLEKVKCIIIIKMGTWQVYLTQFIVFFSKMETIDIFLLCITYIEIYNIDIDPKQVLLVFQCRGLALLRAPLIQGRR